MKPREPRRKVLISARMRIGGALVDICIRDISQRGLLAQAATSPSRGTYVEIFWTRHIIVGRVIWNKERRFGIQTQDRMNVSALADERSLLNAARDTGSAVRRSAEGRSDPHRLTAAKIAERLERSRRLSAAFQFGCIITCGVAAAAFTASVVQKTLARPFAHISALLP